MKNKSKYAVKPKRPRELYKEPVHLFTSGSLRLAAWAGWHSALGDKNSAESYVHFAYAAWVRESLLATGRKFDFLARFNGDIYSKIDFETLRQLTDEYIKEINREISKANKISAMQILWNKHNLKPMKPVARVKGKKTVADLLIEDRE